MAKTRQKKPIIMYLVAWDVFAKNTFKTRRKHVINTKREGCKQLRFTPNTGVSGKTDPKGVVIMRSMI